MANLSCARWDWSKINTENIYFPKDFLWGVATSEYQNSGAVNCPDSNWASWESTKFDDGKPHIERNEKSGVSSDFYNKYFQDIQNVKKDLGINSFRFSIEWSKIEPQEGIFDAEALNHYSEFCDYLLAHDIVPMITLHHFTHPQWFEDKGAFERKENIEYFVRFSKKVFELLSDRITLWCTINEPNIYAFQGYVRGVFPPGKTGMGGKLLPTVNHLAVTVLKNLMLAHVEVYNALKEMPYGKRAQIGIVHQYLKFEPYGVLNPFEYLPGSILGLNYFLNDVLINFYETGVFKFQSYTPCIDLKYKADGKKCMDFIGLNYYSRALVAIRPGHEVSSCYEHEIMTDMPYAIYGEGLYQAIEKMAKLKMPIYITETGISDAKDDRRGMFIKQYLYAASKAIAKGHDLRGFYYWSMTDNFEWDMGYNQHFGLYSVDLKTQERKLREGAKYYGEVIKKSTFGLFTNRFINKGIPTIQDPYFTRRQKLSLGVACIFAVGLIYYKYFVKNKTDEKNLAVS